MKLHRKLLLLAGAGLLLGGSSLLGAEKSASAILDTAYRYIGSLNTYAFVAAVQDDDEKGEKIKHKVCVKVKRPDKLRVDIKGDIKDRTVYLNDGLFTMIDHQFNYYGQLKTPKTIDGTLDYIFDKYGINAPLAALIYSDMDKRTRYQKITYFGTKTVNGTECDYVAFKSNNITVHLWIATGTKPLVKAYAIIVDADGKQYRKDTSVKWNTDPKLSDKDFVFVAPKGASKISIKPAM